MMRLGPTVVEKSAPTVVEKAADERIGDVSEEDVFTDAVCEFSRSDSFKEETATNFLAKGTENPSELPSDANVFHRVSSSSNRISNL